MNVSASNWNISTAENNITYRYSANTTQGSLNFNVTTWGLNGFTKENLGEALNNVTPAKTWISSTRLHEPKRPPDIPQLSPIEPQTFLPSENISTSPIYHSEHRVFGDPDINHGHVGAATVLTALSVLVIVITMWIYYRRHDSYEHIEDDGQHGANCVYKPLIGAGLDDEYENTFVGVSIPLLQDNTKL